MLCKSTNLKAIHNLDFDMDLMTFADAVDVETAMAWAASIQDDQPEESEGDEKKAADH